jgi:hypothetical protein
MYKNSEENEVMIVSEDEILGDNVVQENGNWIKTRREVWKEHI